MSSAKIEFTVKLEDITKEVDGRLNQLYNLYKENGNEFRSILNLSFEDSPIAAATKLDNIRKELAYIDAVLRDSYNILVGYADYKSKLISEQPVISEPEKAKNE